MELVTMQRVTLFLVGVPLGLVVGLVFFGGLWWTTQRLALTRRPGLLLTTSLFVRLATLAVCLVVVARFDGAALIGVLGGLIATRIVMTRAASQDRLWSFPMNAQPPNVGT